MIEMMLFVIIHERVGFCLGLAVGCIIVAAAIWIASLL